MLRSVTKLLRTTRGRLLLLLPALLVVAGGVVLALVLFDGEPPAHHLKDPTPDSNEFHIAGDAAPFGGPTPMTVRFFAEAFDASGDVSWHWNFDDGTISRKRQPVHTFPRAGYYQMVVVAKDEKGHRTGTNIRIGAWPPKVWKRSGKLSNAGLLGEVQKQTRRTAKRWRELKAKGLPFFTAAAYPGYKPRREPLAPGG
jgi:hypothetical protein